VEHGFSHIAAGIRLNHAYEYFLLAERYGWTHHDILSLTRAEALYYLLAPIAYERERMKHDKNKRR